MASTTSSLQSLQHTLLHPHHHSSSSFPYPDSSSSLLLKPPTTPQPQRLFSNLSSSLTTSTSPLTPSTSSSFDLLARQLSSNDFRQADEETRRLLIVLAGEAAQKRGYVFFSEAQFIPSEDLQAIDRLWRQHSNNRFGYSVQRKVWEKAGRDFTRFFLKVGWMKRLDTEIEQYNYRAFPNEFVWELKDDTPEGHLPLTNALRGTQLLASILTHPAFESIEDQVEAAAPPPQDKDMGSEESREKPPKPISKREVFKPDYSF